MHFLVALTNVETFYFHIFLKKIKRKTAIRGKLSSLKSESPSFSDAVIQG